MADDPAPIYKTRVKDDGDADEAPAPKKWKRGDTRQFGGEEYESYGSRGTKKGGNQWKDEDKEGDLDVEGWKKAQDEGYKAATKTYPDGKQYIDTSSAATGLRVTDEPDADDPKGWRRHFWRRKDKQEKPNS